VSSSINLVHTQACLGVTNERDEKERRATPALTKLYSGKNAIGGRSATSEIALQRKGEGGQRGVARFNVMIVDPSYEFSSCYCH
jgi:hypothetical protein